MKVITSVIAILFIASMVNIQPVQAQSDTEEQFNEVFSLSDLGYEADDEYQGVLVTHQYDINLPLTWEIDGLLKLTVHFQHSPSLRSSSSMAIDWNGTRIDSVLLNSSNAESGYLVASIPAELINAGYNQLSIEFYMGIHDNFCEDFDNPSVWAVVKNDTSFALNSTIKKPAARLENIPETFINNSPLMENQLIIAIPDNPSIDELDAAALVSTRLGQMASWRDFSLKTMTLNKVLQQKPTGNLIFVGIKNNLASAAASLVPANISDNEDGILWVQSSPYDESALWLTVTGSTENGIQKAARAFASSSSYALFSGSLGKVQKTPEVSTEVESSPTLSYSFSELGYADLVSKGSRQQSVYVNLPMQLVFDSQAEAVLHLFYSHSHVSDEEKSSMSVSVNGIPVADILLTSKNEQNASVDIKIPLRLLQIGNNSILFTSNVQKSISSDDQFLYCLDEYYDTSWLTIGSNSTITFPTGIGKNSASLSGFPNLYLGAPTLANMAIVVPDTIDSITANTVLQIANRIGHNVKGDQIQAAVITASEQQESMIQRPYQIFVGLPSTNSAIANINDLMPQPFETDLVTPKEVQGVVYIIPDGSAFGYVQSLFTEDGDYRLVLTATTAEGLRWVSEFINDPTAYDGITGNLVVLTDENNSTFFTIDDQISLETEKPSTESILINNQLVSYPVWILWLAGIIITILSVVMIYVYLKNKSRK